MERPYQLDELAHLLPVHGEHFDEYVYLNALLSGYSDEEAYHRASADIPQLDTSTKGSHQYPDPELFSQSFDHPTTETNRTMLNDREDSRRFVQSEYDSTFQPGMHDGATGLQQAADHDTSKTQSALSPTPEPSLDASVTPSTGSSPYTPGRDIEQPATPRNLAETDLPETYAGRRSAAGRSGFPRECGACGKRFLYDDSAQKHYRKHHGEPVNIILRWNAPKRPLPGRPRNKKAAVSRARRSRSPPGSSLSDYASRSTEMDRTPEDSRYSDAFSIQSPLQTPSKIPSAFYGLPMADRTRSIEVDRGCDPVNVPYPASSGLAKPYAPLMPVDISPTLKRSTEQDSHSGGGPRILSQFGSLQFPTDDARFAALQVRRAQTSRMADTAQEAIAIDNPHLLEWHFQDTENSSTTPGRLPYAKNILRLRSMASQGHIPPLPPDWAYNMSDTSLTWHADFGKYYKHSVDGKWQAWREDILSWE